MNRVPVPTARLAIVAAVASIVAVAVPGTVITRLLVVNGFLAAVALVDLLAATGTADLEIDRSMPSVATLGSAVGVSWAVTNRGRRAVTVHLADDFPPSFRAGTRRIHGRIAAGATLTATTTIAPRRRGEFSVTDVVVRVEGPLGLASRQHVRSLPATLRVHPRFASRREAELRIDRARILDVGMRSATGRGGGTDFDQLRDYSVDDEFRRIDWSATARASRPIVRTYRAERNQHVVVLMDNGRVMAGRVDGMPRTEYAMDATLLLTTVATRLGDRCGLLTFDREVRSVIAPSHGRNQVNRVTDALFRLEPVLAESDYRGAFTEAVARFRRRSMFVVLTDLVEQAVGEALLPALPVITQRHLVLIGAVQDPIVRAWADQTPTDGDEAYRQAAAARTLASRARAAARLRAAGAQVIDTTPARLAVDLGDAYLDVKASGRL